MGLETNPLLRKLFESWQKGNSNALSFFQHHQRHEFKVLTHKLTLFPRYVLINICCKSCTKNPHNNRHQFNIYLLPLQWEIWKIQRSSYFICLKILRNKKNIKEKNEVILFYHNFWVEYVQNYWRLSDTQSLNTDSIFCCNVKLFLTFERSVMHKKAWSRELNSRR